MHSDPPATADLLDVLRRRRALFGVLFILSLLGGVLLAFMLPPRYRARAILLPPDERGLPPLTPSDRNELLAGGDDVGPLEVLETPAGLAARLLSTRPVIERALASLKPSGGWPPGEAERLRAVLTNGTRSWVTDEKIVFVEVEAEDGRTAAAAANALGKALDAWNRQRRTSMARAAREALDHEVNTVETEMHSLADSLAVLQAAARGRGPGSAEILVDPLVAEEGARGEIARRIVLLRGELWSLGAERGKRRAEEIDPRPAVEFVEAATVPDEPARPVRPAVVLLVVAAGLLAAAAVSVLADMLESARAARRARAGLTR